MNTTLSVSPLESLPLVTDLSVDSLMDLGKPESILDSHSRKFISKCLLIVYANQTASEQAAGQTVVHNGKGFNGKDAGFLSSLAQWAERRELTDKQSRYAAKLLAKYRRQILAGW